MTRSFPRTRLNAWRNALLAKKKLFGLVMFADEQHGFRKAETIRRALDAKLDFYSVMLTRSGLRL